MLPQAPPAQPRTPLHPPRGQPLPAAVRLGSLTLAVSKHSFWGLLDNKRAIQSNERPASSPLSGLPALLMPLSTQRKASDMRTAVLQARPLPRATKERSRVQGEELRRRSSRRHRWREPEEDVSQAPNDSVHVQTWGKDARRPPRSSERFLGPPLLSPGASRGQEGSDVPCDSKDPLCPGHPIPSALAHNGHSVTTDVLPSLH